MLSVRSTVAMLALFALVACGRIGFDSSGDGGHLGGGADGSQALIANLVFVTSTMQPIGTIGLDGADAICMNLGAAGGVPGHYVAWLSTPSINARDRLGTARGWQRRDGWPMADTIADLTAGNIYYPPSVDEVGGSQQDLVATGTLADGTAGANTCSGWTSTATTASTGASYYSAPDWTADGGGGYFCTASARFYCFQIDKSIDVRPLVAGTGVRRAFVTDGLWVPGGGRATADALCQGEAMPLGGSFLAMMATDTEAAVARFDLTKPPWKRLDGADVTQTTAAFAAGDAFASLDLTPSGAHIAQLVATGATRPDQIGSQTCVGDWTSASPSQGFQSGISNGSDGNLFGYLPDRKCSLGGHVYCFEQ